MKLVINNTGNIEEVENKLALRMINKGTAHPVKEQKIKEEVIEAELVLDGIEEVAIKPKVKVIKKPRIRRKKSELISDSVDFEDHIKGFEEKKKSKLRSWND